MSFRPTWNTLRNVIYSFVSNALRTQAQIDGQLANLLDDYGTIIQHPNDLPSNAKRRRRIFFSPNDIMSYLDDGAIPADYVYLRVIHNYRGTGDQAIEIYIQPN